jgi:hypothetical protein
VNEEAIAALGCRARDDDDDDDDDDYNNNNNNNNKANIGTNGFSPTFLKSCSFQ